MFEEMSIMCRYHRLLMSSYGLQGGFRDFVVFSSDITVFRWSHYSLFSVVLCFIFIAVYPHVCMCTEMLPSDTVGGAHFFIMHENKSHWVKWNTPNNNSR